MHCTNTTTWRKTESDYIIIEDVDEVYAKALELGLTVLYELADQPYGIRDFSVEGPDKIPVAVGREVR